MNFVSIDNKCGEIFLIKTSVYVFTCYHCNLKFDNFQSFRTHTESFHYDHNFTMHNDLKPIAISTEVLSQNVRDDPESDEAVVIEKLDSTLDDDLEQNLTSKKLFQVFNETAILHDENYVYSFENEYFQNFESNRQNLHFKQNLNHSTSNLVFEEYINSDSEINIKDESHGSFETNRTDSSFVKEKFDNKDYEYSCISENERDFKDNINRNKTVCCPYCKYEFKLFQKHDVEKCFSIQNTIKSHNFNFDSLKLEGIYLCNKCPRYFENSKQLASHRRVSHSSGTCKICNKTLARLGEHMKNQHPGEHFEKSEIINENNDVDNLQCIYCEKKFKMKYHLLKHEKSHQNESLKCKYCGKYFRRPVLLKNHIRTHTGERPFQCTQCPAAFALKRNLKTHFIYKHTEEKPFECRYQGGCGKYFKTDQLRNFHEQRHNESSEFQCEICGIDFNVKAKLKMHYKRKHMDYSLRPHHCSFCEKKFVKKGHLREHERTHTGEKPLKCDQCTSSFAKSSSLREHKKLHTGEKNHVCKICGKAFAQTSGYSNHMKNHP